MHSVLFNFRVVAILIIALAIQSCSVNPVTGKTELSLMSQQQEIALGSKNYAPSRQSQGGDYYIDPSLQAYVTNVGQKLAAISDQPNLPYEFVVLNNAVPNAWALPGGKIAINRGLLVYLEDESQLAAVLAHEIVHAAARHGASQMSRGMLVNLGMTAVTIGTQNQQGAEMYGLASRLGAATWMAKYGRNDELESDFYGMDYMAKAGYAPQGAVELQQTFVKLSEGKQTDFLSGLFASHPPSIQRVEANRARAKTLPEGKRYRQRYQSAIAQLQKDAPAYQAQQDAMAALDQKQPRLAISELDKAVALQPKEASFWLLRGRSWQQLQQPDNANKAYTTAITKNPNYFGAYLARGILRYEQGKKSLGLVDINRSHQLLPTAQASYYLGEAAVEAEQYEQAVAYFEQARQAGGKLQKQAEQQLVVLKLRLEPQSFIRASGSLNSRGYLQISLVNQSPVAMNQIQLRVDTMANAFQVRSSRNLSVSQTIAAGKTVQVQLNVGAIDGEQIPTFRLVVQAAKPLNTL
jgi:predicted Zn-dependent protease